MSSCANSAGKDSLPKTDIVDEPSDRIISAKTEGLKTGCVSRRMILSEVILGSMPTVQCFASDIVSADSIANGGNIPTK